MSLPTSSSSSIISTYHHATTPEIEVEGSLPSGHRSLLHQFALSKGVSRYCGKYDPDMMPQPSQQFKSGIVVNCHHQSVSQSVSQSVTLPTSRRYCNKYIPSSQRGASRCIIRHLHHKHKFMTTLLLLVSIFMSFNELYLSENYSLPNCHSPFYLQKLYETINGRQCKRSLRLNLISPPPAS